ncbi:MAG: hypothetical protein JW993_12480, partial [Sedimentisphaerales bacterium]|nr:hypothetical protein [Sedimentisphaerales bacterium]
MAARQSHRSTLLAASLYVVFCASGARAALINSTWQCGTDNYSKNTCWDPLLAISPYNRGSLEFEVTIPAGSGTVSMDLDVAPCTEVNSFFLGEGRTFKVLAGKCYKVLGQADIYGTIWGNGGNFIAPDANFPQCKAQVWVDSGGYVEIGAPTYCATQLTTNHELLMADGAGSLLDLSAMMELNDAFTNSSNSVAEHSIVAEDGGVIDLS